MNDDAILDALKARKRQVNFKLREQKIRNNQIAREEAKQARINRLRQECIELESQLEDR